MSITATQKKSESKVVGARPKSASPSVTVDLATPIEAPLIQRKSGCACGGGCPKCQSDTLGIQPKLTIGAPNDEYEREADRVADQVMRMPVRTAHQVMRTPNLKDTYASSGACPKCRKERDDKERFQTPSQPWAVPQAIRRPLELALGHNLSDVRVHSGKTAVRRVRGVGAIALTSGRRIMFDREQVVPDSSAGQHILAHELVHVVQQATIPQAPRLQAYRPRSEDPIHEPIVEEYRRWHPGSEPGRPTEGQIKYQLGLPILTAVLNTQSRTSAEYKRALQAWPNGQQIWPHLNSRRARIEFINYLLEFDYTDCRPYDTPVSPGQSRSSAACATIAHNQETFVHLCGGFATQLHLRFRAQPERPGADQIERLRSQARIYYRAIDPKFRIPILIAQSPAHDFNAILVGHDPSNIESYLFVEPQFDQLFEPSSAQFGRSEYFARGMLQLSEFSEISESGNLEGPTRHCFIRDISGQVIDADLTDEACDLVDDVIGAIFVADYPSADYERSVGNHTTYESYARRILDSVPDDHLVQVAPYFIGRRFRRSPGGDEETLDINTFLQLAGRESLRQQLEHYLEHLRRRYQRTP